MLEKAYAAEVNGALTGGFGLMQTRSKIAAKLVEDGYLRPTEETLRDRFGVIKVRGYELTDLGRLTYCMSCDDS